MEVYIGCSGWSYQEWKGVFYPTHLPARNYLSYYASHFNTLEVNSTFYHFPTEKAVHAWNQQVPHDFRFSLKMSRLVTHTHRMKQVQEPVQQFYGLQEILQDKLGYFLFSFLQALGFWNTIWNSFLVRLTHIITMWSSAIQVVGSLR